MMIDAHAYPVPLVQLDDVSRVFGVGTQRVTALDHVNLRLHEGEKVAVVGASGSGKTTLMNLVGLLDTPSEGDTVLDGVSTRELGPTQRARLRNTSIGLVFQHYHLLPQLTAVQNVELTMLYRGVGARDARDQARAALADVGLDARAEHVPAQLSGGERQRVAIARALVGKPRLLLADEPTGALDTATSDAVLDLLIGNTSSSGCALVVVTHDAGVAARLSRRIAMRDGRIVSDSGAHG